MTTPMSEIVRDITHGAYDDALDLLSSALNARQRRVREDLVLGMRASLQPGSQVRLVANMKPKYLSHAECTVVELEGDSAVVKLNDTYTWLARKAARYIRRVENEDGEVEYQLHTPLSILEPVDVDEADDEREDADAEPATA